MIKNVVLSQESLDDVRQAYIWYESKSARLGDQFLAQVGECIELICREPNLFELVHNNYRRVMVKRFPYAVFYKHDGETVTIGSIFQTS